MYNICTICIYCICRALCTAHGNRRAISRSAYKKEICTILNPRKFASQRCEMRDDDDLFCISFYFTIFALFFMFACLSTLRSSTCVCVYLDRYIDVLGISAYTCILLHGHKRNMTNSCLSVVHGSRHQMATDNRPKRPQMQPGQPRLECIPCKLGNEN